MRGEGRHKIFICTQHKKKFTIFLGTIIFAAILMKLSDVFFHDSKHFLKFLSIMKKKRPITYFGYVENQIIFGKPLFSILILRKKSGHILVRKGGRGFYILLISKISDFFFQNQKQLNKVH